MDDLEDESNNILHNIRCILDAATNDKEFSAFSENIIDEPIIIAE
jgi:hypothetical protein